MQLPVDISACLIIKCHIYPQIVPRRPFSETPPTTSYGIGSGGSLRLPQIRFYRISIIDTNMNIFFRYKSKMHIFLLTFNRTNSISIMLNNLCNCAYLVEMLSVNATE
jgi:hypothetical protein